MDLTSKETGSDGLITNVKAGLGFFSLVMKNFALYPEASPIRQQALANFYNWLTSFLDDYDKLHLTVGNDCFICDDEVVYQDKPNEQSLVAPLFRDGINWFEFTANVTTDEIATFVSLLNKFRVLREDAADDFATALWEADLTHIKYKTADEFWETDPMADIATLNLASEASDDAAGQAYVKAGSNTVGYVLRALAQDSNPGGQAALTAGLGPGQPPREAGHKSGDLAPDVDTLSAGSLEKAGLEEQLDDDFLYQEGVSLLFEEISAKFNGMGEASGHGQMAGRLPEGALIYLDQGDSDGTLTTPTRSGLNDGEEAGTASDSVASLVTRSTIYYENDESDQLWRLGPDEEAALKAMIESEENRNTTQDALDILLEVIRVDKSNPDKSDPVSDFLLEEVQSALSQGDFYFVRVFLEKLRKLAITDPEAFALVAFDLEDKIASPEVLSVLDQTWPAGVITEESLQDLWRILVLLPPKVINALVSVLARPLPEPLEKILIRVLAMAAIQPKVEALPVIGLMRPSLLLELVSLFKTSALNLTPPLELLVGLTKHESPKVREVATEILLERHPEAIKNLFHLIDDSHQPINKMICDHLGLQRSPLAEKVLGDYLSEAYNEKKSRDKGHILNCYRAFGLCSSKQSLSFLQDILLKRDFKSFLGLDATGLHRLGAAVALMSMPVEWGAQRVIEEARQSRFKTIRQVCQQAENELMAFRGNQHG